MKFDTKSMEERMGKAIASFESTLSTVRASQANPGVLSRVTFDYYGSPTPLNSMADVRVSDARTLTITPYDASTLKAMEKAILMSDVGITPMNDGKVIRLAFPQLTEERRREIKKQVQKYAEEAKVAIRNIRRDANEDAKKQKKDGLLTEDDQKAAEKTIQDITDKNIKKIEEIQAKKEKEIMAI
ncbi:MAG: ribosome recycling factor [Ruminococcaceae bacterium]|nr:ribosome recycling factor [Oscillospiraceae bacterium]MBQ7398084.1 ribosome recycling factor [Clostridia bacterium]